MQLVLASGNKGKLREFRAMSDGEIVPFGEVMEPFEIVEDGDTFAANALIKARAIYEKLGEEYIVIADDSGISVPVLGGEPGIYSARYAGEDADDRDNLYKLIDTLKTRGIKRTPAYYTAAIAIVSAQGEYIVHGWMHGEAIAEARGEKGFGYDPMFIPEGHEQTLGELDDAVKKSISHRSKALVLARPIIEILSRK
jgi:XTP/dITP diphosphohydrolase